jgi:hypothetical protein
VISHREAKHSLTGPLYMKTVTGVIRSYANFFTNSGARGITELKQKCDVAPPTYYYYFYYYEEEIMKFSSKR